MDFIPVDTAKEWMALDVCCVIGVYIEPAIVFIARVHTVKGMLGCQAKGDGVIHAILVGGQAMFFLLQEIVYQVDCFSRDELIGWSIWEM